LLENCRTGHWYRKDLREPLVLAAVDTLVEISVRTNQKIPPIPNLSLAGQTGTIGLHGFDLSKEPERHRLAMLLLGEPTPNLQSVHQDWQDKPRSANEPKRANSERVGRNDPCPCGSGKKFKKCCYR
jgi:hypothetical protein